MIQRALFSTALFFATAISAEAAIPDSNAPPSKPSLNRASPMINDPALTIIGKSPASKPADPAIQAAVPAEKPVLYRASPMMDDRLMGKPIHGPAPKPH